MPECFLNKPVKLSRKLAGMVGVLEENKAALLVCVQLHILSNRHTQYSRTTKILHNYGSHFQRKPIPASYHLVIPSVLWRCWLGDRKDIRPVKKNEWWGAGVDTCLERGADLHTAQLMPLPLTVSCFSKIQIGFTFLIPAHTGSPRKGPLMGVCVSSCDECVQTDACLSVHLSASIPGETKCPN